MDIYYEIYAITSTMTDVEQTNDLEGAIKIAKEWSQDSNNEIVIEEVHRQIVKRFKKGNETND